MFLFLIRFSFRPTFTLAAKISSGLICEKLTQKCQNLNVVKISFRLYNLRKCFIFPLSCNTEERQICLLIMRPFCLSFTASISIRNLRNIPKVALTVKPDPNDTLSRSLNDTGYYLDTNGYKKPSEDVKSLYTNGQVQQQQGISAHQDPLQHQYAVVKKTGSKRDIRDNLERENPAVFKVC